LTDSLRSMTGYGSGSRSSDGLEVACELRCVNHRYLKVSAHLPDGLAGLQGSVERKLRDTIERGSLSLTVQVTRENRELEMPLDDRRLSACHKRLQELWEGINPEGDAVQLADVLQAYALSEENNGRKEDAEKLDELLIAALDEALDSLRLMQVREGDHLRAELYRLCEKIENCLSMVQEGQGNALTQLTERYLSRINALIANGEISVDSRELAREVAVLTEKTDVTEEMERLNGHLAQYREAVDSGGRVGRRLEFLTQEMLREANTMAAKVNRLEIASVVVDCKVEIDRLREQTQNIE